MKLQRLSLIIAISMTLVGPAFGAGSAPPVLPSQFGGWELAGAVGSSADPAVADPLNAELLKEYGFTDLATATYTRDDGRKLRIKAARFNDATGANGAFTYYKMPQMRSDQIGDQGAS
jgi:hypothetical protein